MIRIGWSTKDVSTNEPVGMVGQFYQRISTGTLDETLITAMVIEREDVSIMVSGDFVSFEAGIIHEVRDAVRAKNPDIPAQNIILNATHTHTCPRYQLKTGFDVEGIDPAIYPPEKYRAFLVSEIANAVCEAYENRAEGSFAYGYGSAETGVSRRVVYMDDYGMRESGRPDSLSPNGHGVMYGKTNDPMFSGYEGSMDTNAYFFFTFDKNEKLTGAIINVACPSQCGEHERYVSSDYWHFVREFIYEKYGRIHILPQCAAAGDLSPHRLHANAARDRRAALKYGDDPKHTAIAEKSVYPSEYYNKMDIAERIYHAFDEVYSWAAKEKIKDAPVYHSVINPELDAWMITDEQYKTAKEELKKYEEENCFRPSKNCKNEKENRTVYYSVLGRYRAVIARYEQGIKTRSPELHNVRIGDVSFSSNPFELYIDYQHRIQARSPFTQSFIVQLAASVGVSGYLCTKRAKENMGYSAIIYSCSVSPEGGDQLVNYTVNDLIRLKEKS